MVRRAVAEALATALLLATIVGSGIMAERLAGGNVWLHRGPTSRGDGCYAVFRWRALSAEGRFRYRYCPPLKVNSYD